MSTITFNDQPVTVSRGRPGSLPMKWQDPSGAAIDVSGFVITSEFRWRDDMVRSVSIDVDDAHAGAFTLIKCVVENNTLLNLAAVTAAINLNSLSAAGLIVGVIALPAS